MIPVKFEPHAELKLRVPKAIGPYSPLVIRLSTRILF